MQRNSLVLLCLLLALSVLSVPSYASAGDWTTSVAENVDGGETQPTTREESLIGPGVEQGCPAFNVCVYQFQNFEGARAMRECQFAGESLGGIYRSARNRCGPGGRSNLLKLGLSIVACMVPGGDRPGPGAFSSIFIFGDTGPHC